MAAPSMSSTIAFAAIASPNKVKLARTMRTHIDGAPAIPCRCYFEADPRTRAANLSRSLSASVAYVIAARPAD
ncbi:hypothetical protein PsYK624_149430 [Phanerochaete sordida]|uniref:Uncharacterized protein n=1 Tax=Phanerochaete sordida TaxID=48140 RepID=A0A9P3GPH5_9APHY|nr:hypothetical protein PsYK624_149430 [Phanerochaete sordida]